MHCQEGLYSTSANVNKMKLNHVGEMDLMTLVRRVIRFPKREVVIGTKPV